MLSLCGLAAYLFAAILASSPLLHHLFHHDADRPEHRCAATVIAQGHLEVTISTASVAIPGMVWHQTWPARSFCYAPPDFQWPPERGPPASHT